MKITNKPILLVEDDQVDTMTANRTLKEIHVTNPVVSLENGEEALLQDKLCSFDLGVAGYMAKPVNYRRFVEVMRSIDAYWTISEMPQ